MAHYSVAKTRDNLSSLIDKALAGEEVIITRHGKPTVTLSVVPAAKAPQVDMAARLAGLEDLRLLREARPPSPISSADLVQHMRDEYRY
jgi:prevent-host-death family protein